jgi:hypothetical protein
LTPIQLISKEIFTNLIYNRNNPFAPAVPTQQNPFGMNFGGMQPPQFPQMGGQMPNMNGFNSANGFGMPQNNPTFPPNPFSKPPTQSAPPVAGYNFKQKDPAAPASPQVII